MIQKLDDSRILKWDVVLTVNGRPCPATGLKVEFERKSMASASSEEQLPVPRLSLNGQDIAADDWSLVLIAETYKKPAKDKEPIIERR